MTVNPLSEETLSEYVPSEAVVVDSP